MTTDSRVVLTQGCHAAAGIVLGARGAHAVNESILIDRIAGRVALLAKLLGEP